MASCLEWIPASEAPKECGPPTRKPGSNRVLPTQLMGFFSPQLGTHRTCGLANCIGVQRGHLCLKEAPRVFQNEPRPIQSFDLNLGCSLRHGTAREWNAANPVQGRIRWNRSKPF